MRECVLVPDAVGVEYEHLLGLHVAEDHVGVEHVDGPEELAGHNICVDFLKVFDVYYDSANAPVEVDLVEDHLLCVGQQFRVERKEAHVSHHAGHAQTSHDKGHEQKLRDTCEPSKPAEHDEVVHDARADQCVSLCRFIKEDAIFAGLNATCKPVVVTLLVSALVIKNCPQQLEQ